MVIAIFNFQHKFSNNIQNHIYQYKIINRFVITDYMAAIVGIDRTKKNSMQWFTHLYLILFFQGVFFGSIFICVYAIVTLNFQLMIFLAIVSVLQRFGKRSEFVINMVNKYVRPTEYFRSFKRIYQEQIPQDQASLFGIHPHSVLSYCIPANMNADHSKMSMMTGLASRFILSMPFIGLELRLWGIQSVNAKNIKNLMKARKPIGLVPGGFEEATLTTPKQLRIFIKERKGFLKYALDYGYTTHPVLVYNQHKAFWTLDAFKTFRLWLNKFKMPGTIFGGGFLGIFLPLNLDYITIVGKGIRRNPSNVGKQVTQEQLSQIHELYIKQLERMHAKYKDQYGQAQLVIY